MSLISDQKLMLTLTATAILAAASLTVAACRTSNGGPPKAEPDLHFVSGNSDYTQTNTTFTLTTDTPVGSGLTKEINLVNQGDAAAHITGLMMTNNFGDAIAMGPAQNGGLTCAIGIDLTPSSQCSISLVFASNADHWFNEIIRLDYITAGDTSGDQYLLNQSVQAKGLLDCTKPAFIASSDNGKNDAATANAQDTSRGASDGAHATYEQGKTAGYNQTFHDRTHEGYTTGYEAGLQRGKEAGQATGEHDLASCTNGAASGANAGTRDGQTDGQADGYTDGYNQGQADGGAAGENDGRVDGIAAGNAEGIATGSSDGTQSGNADGRADGAAAGTAQGQNDGYSDGYTSGELDCLNPEPLKTIEPEQFDKCYNNGFATVRDETLYSKAYTANLSPDYTRGVNDGKTEGTAASTSSKNQGIASGDADGYRDGLVIGLSQGKQAIYQSCYTQAYQQAYETNYANGYNSTAASGYTDGSADGYLVSYQASFTYNHDNAFAVAYQQAAAASYQASYTDSFNATFQQTYSAAWNSSYDQGYVTGYEDSGCAWAIAAVPAANGLPKSKSSNASRLITRQETSKAEKTPSEAAIQSIASTSAPKLEADKAIGKKMFHDILTPKFAKTDLPKAKKLELYEASHQAIRLIGHVTPSRGVIGASTLVQLREGLKFDLVAKRVGTEKLAARKGQWLPIAERLAEDFKALDLKTPPSSEK